MKLKTIQIYRGFVALIITVSHAIEVLNKHSFPGLDFLELRTGGVDFFFTLSGFIIFYVFSKYPSNSNVIKFFLLKRLLRIYPLVWFFTLLSLPVYFLNSTIGDGNETQLLVIFYSLFLLPQAVAPVLGATWSLSHVILFYVVFYFYIVRPRLTSWILVSWLMALIYHFTFVNYEQEKRFLQILESFIFSPFNLEFLIGTALAKFVLSGKNRFGFEAILIGFVLFVFGWIFLQKDSYALLVTLTFCAAAALMILGGVGVENKFAFTIPKYLDVLGSASYAIIIVNLPIIIVCTLLLKKFFYLGPIPNWISFVSAVLCVNFAIAGGIFSYKFIEPNILFLFRKHLAGK